MPPANCANCGARLPKGGRFCPECGIRMSDAGDTAVPGVDINRLVEQINGVRNKAAVLAGSATALADVKAAAAQLNAKADALRKQIVATKEGGAITGEERLREHTDDVYGAITSVDSLRL